MVALIESHAWVYPALGIVHILGIALLLGNLTFIELRVFGLGAALPVKELAKLGLGLVALGFCMAAASGLLMFSTRAAELLATRVFTLKMLILCTIACNAAWFHGRGSLDKLDAIAKAQMVLSSLLWLGVVVCGRWIALN